MFYKLFLSSFNSFSYGHDAAEPAEDIMVYSDLLEYWQYSHFTLDVLDGLGPGGFSLETPLGKTFKVHYRLFSPEELKNLEPIMRNE